MASSSPPEWSVLYHAPGKFKGRGEFLRLLLSRNDGDVQVTFEAIAADEADQKIA